MKIEFTELEEESIEEMSYLMDISNASPEQYEKFQNLSLIFSSKIIARYRQIKIKAGVNEVGKLSESSSDESSKT